LTACADCDLLRRIPCTPAGSGGALCAKHCRGNPGHQDQQDPESLVHLMMKF
jgi:hypothetical protein